MTHFPVKITRQVQRTGKKLPLYCYVDFSRLTKNKIYLLRGNFQQIPRSLVVKQMDRESNANSKASVQGTVW